MHTISPLRSLRILNNSGVKNIETGAVIFDDLRAIQTRHGFLPKAELEFLSQRTQTPLYQIHSVASFYPHFHLAPPPKADLRVCADMSCHLNGTSELRSALQSSFANARPEDVQIRDVSCLGRCDHAPAISLNDYIFTGVTASMAEQLTRAALRGELLQDLHHASSSVVCKSDPYAGPEAAGGKYAVTRTLVQTLNWDG
ncbi:MAG TPA: NAD(P)H-dependent oxidoreductase subunit E, partial [Candidatus Dormibacteraeota bacterium]|nr:NAD(P)H-dependent oxidoreductase subunit E [Candidatus Dormibacteraeota bacterium]